MSVELARSPAAFEARYARLLRGTGVPPSLALRRGLAVHRNNAMAAAAAALTANYPVLAAMLGDDAFAALAARHVAHYPPRDPRLCLYGADLAGTITASDELADYPWLPDVARLEWLVVQALFAANSPAHPRRLVPSRAWPLAPATGWIASPHPVVSLWHAHQPGAAWPDAFLAADTLALVTRTGGHISVSSLAPDALPLLDALRRRTPLARLQPADLAHLPALAAAGALVPAIGDA